MYENIRNVYKIYFYVCFGIIVSSFIITALFARGFCTELNHKFWYHLGWIKWEALIAFIGHIIVSIFTYLNHLPVLPSFNTIKMNFKQFRDIYPINPDAWDISTFRIYYEYEEVNPVHKYTKSSNGESVYRGTRIATKSITNVIYFNFLDWVRFVFWLRARYKDRIRADKEYLKRAQNESLARMLVNVQKDIDEVIKKMQEDIKE